MGKLEQTKAARICIRQALLRAKDSGRRESQKRITELEGLLKGALPYLEYLDSGEYEHPPRDFVRLVAKIKKGLG